MPKEWTDEEVQKEIADAIAIVREDRFETFVRSTIGPKSGDAGNPGNAGTDAGNDNSGNPGKAKKSLWWGETE
jgi:hypothetical protein